ncbi:hypothetical protein AKJ16_DCAP15218 [Drosera capensis]
MVMMYVDDMIITGSDTTHIEQVKVFIHSKFQIKDVEQSPKFNVTDGHISASGWAPDLSDYYRPEITFAINTLSQFMHSSQQSCMDAALRILRYLKSTPDKEHTFRRPPLTTTGDLPLPPITPTALSPSSPSRPPLPHQSHSDRPISTTYNSQPAPPSPSVMSNVLWPTTDDHGQIKEVESSRMAEVNPYENMMTDSFEAVNFKSMVGNMNDFDDNQSPAPLDDDDDDDDVMDEEEDEDEEKVEKNKDEDLIEEAEEMEEEKEEQDNEFEKSTKTRMLIRVIDLFWMTLLRDEDKFFDEDQPTPDLSPAPSRPSISLASRPSISSALRPSISTAA